jgi:hypothetical protein
MIPGSPVPVQVERASRGPTPIHLARAAPGPHGRDVLLAEPRPPVMKPTYAQVSAGLHGLLPFKRPGSCVRRFHHRVTESPSHRVTESPSHRVTESPSHRVTESPSQDGEVVPTRYRARRSTRSTSRIVTERGSNRIHPRAAKSASALLTVSRDAPTSCASSSWVRS